MSKTETEKLVTDLRTIAHDAEKILISSAEAAGEKAYDVKEKIMSAFDFSIISLLLSWLLTATKALPSLFLILLYSFWFFILILFSMIRSMT